MIPERLKLLRENKNLSKTELAKQLDMPYTTYVNYESGSREPGSDFLIKISKFYNVSIDYIMGVSNTFFKEEELNIVGGSNGNVVDAKEQAKECYELKNKASRLIYSGEFDIRQLKELIEIIKAIEKTRW